MHMLPLIVSSRVLADGLVSCLREGLAYLFPFLSSNGLCRSGPGISSLYTYLLIVSCPKLVDGLASCLREG